MIQKYAAALITIAIALVTALTQLPGGHINRIGLEQLLVVVLQAFATYLLPLIPGNWQHGLKVAVNALLAATAALYPLLTTGHITGAQWAVVLLAALNVLGTEVGGQIRAASTPAARHLAAPASSAPATMPSIGNDTVAPLAPTAN